MGISDAIFHIRKPSVIRCTILGCVNATNGQQNRKKSQPISVSRDRRGVKCQGMIETNVFNPFVHNCLN